MTHTFYDTHVFWHTCFYDTRFLTQALLRQARCYNTSIFWHMLFMTHFFDTFLTRVFDTRVFYTRIFDTLFGTRFFDTRGFCTHIFWHTLFWHALFDTRVFMTHTFFTRAFWHTRFYDTHFFGTHVFMTHTFPLQVLLAVFPLGLFIFPSANQATTAHFRRIVCFIPCSHFGTCGVTNASACVAGEEYVARRKWCLCCGANCCGACVTTVGTYVIRQHFVKSFCDWRRCVPLWVTESHPGCYAYWFSMSMTAWMLLTVTDRFVW